MKLYTESEVKKLYKAIREREGCLFTLPYIMQPIEVTLSGQVEQEVYHLDAVVQNEYTNKDFKYQLREIL